MKSQLICLSILLCSINSQQDSKIEIDLDWSTYLRDDNKSITLTNRILTNTNGLKNYSFIKTLQLNKNRLGELGEIKYLINIESLNLMDNFLDYIDDLKYLPLISLLDLTNNRIKSLRGIELLTNLNTIFMSSNQVDKLDELEKLTKLVSLNLKSNKIESLKGVENLVNLIDIQLSFNQIKRIDELESLISLKVIDLSSNQIESLRGLEKLNPKILLLNSNKLTRLNCLPISLNLTELRLNFNQIQSIDELKNLSNLRILRLDSNQIESVSALENLVKLEWVHLNSNRIKRIEGFEKMNKLSYLNLESNRLESIESLSKLTGLTNLLLGHNQLESSKGIENMTKLQWIYLNHNKLKFVHGLEKLKKIYILYLNSNQITSINNLPNITETKIYDLKFVIFSNQIKTINKNVLLNLRNLKNIDLRYNSINNLESYSFDSFNYKLNSIYLDGNNLSLILNFTFTNCDSLRVISLDSNSIQYVHSYAFYNLLQLAFISLKYNKLVTISEYAFFKITNFYSLDLFRNFNSNTSALISSYNSLPRSTSFIRLSYESLRDLNQSFLNFSSLDLSSNEIGILFKDSFKGNFKYIDLKNNFVSSLQDDAFNYMPNLETLSFSFNLIRFLDFQLAFKLKLTKLLKLEFKGNRIQAISSTFFEKFPNLKLIDLSNNDFFLLKQSFFFNLPYLESLFLYNNQILTIENKTFQCLPLLKNLDLKNNLIYDLSSRLFLNLKQLNILNLSSNKIEVILNEYFQGLNNLTLLDLSENLLKSLGESSFNELINIEEIFLRSNSLHSFNFSFSKINKLDLSANNLTLFYLDNKMGNISHLDLSHNPLNTDLKLNFLDKLTFLNASNTSQEFILGQIFSNKSQVETLDLSYNNLARIGDQYFSKLKKLKKLYLKAACLSDFDFLLNLNQNILEELDLSHNLELRKSLDYLEYFKKLKLLKISNVSTNNIADINKLNKIKYLDLSSNNLRIYNFFTAELTFLDLSHNRIENLFESNLIEIEDFREFHPNLKRINFIESFSISYSKVILQFNKHLEFAYLSGNMLENFPKFCQFMFQADPFLFPNINFECFLKELKFDSNNLRQILFVDLMDMNNLIYLDLENNHISFVEENSFSNLNNLKTLVLAQNEIFFLNKTYYLFDNLSSLSLLNLSWNRIEFISSEFFYQLFKLVTLDLSFNRIFQIDNFAFYKLYNLKSLYLNENSPFLFIDLEAFRELDSIQNVFVSKSFYNSSEVFIKLFSYKNSKFSKKSLNRFYFKSLFITSPYFNESYDCLLSLFYIRNNIHFNFKTETEIFDYFSECNLLKIKNSSLISETVVERLNLVFSNYLSYSFFLYLFFVLFISLSLCLKNSL